MPDAYIYAALRTPYGKYGGALAGIRPDDLAAAVIKGLLSGLPRLEAPAVDEVILGNANGAGEDNRNVARMAVLLSGLPVSVPATTVNRLCGSSLDAAMMASRVIEVGDASIVIAGGVESMTRAPWVLPKPAKAFDKGDVAAVSTTLGWRLVNPVMPSEWTVSLGAANDMLAETFGISRERQDKFAVRSHLLAEAAWNDGFYDDIVTPLAGLDRDQGIRPDATVESIATLPPAFGSGGTVTAGNASPLSDGASALLIGNASVADVLGQDPIARIAGRGTVALDPRMFGFAPVEAANRALKCAGITWRDVGAVELNEAFAVQALACIDAWAIDPELVNSRGGAIAVGHPLGASGGRILGTVAKRLREQRARWGVGAICIGVGQGLAVVLENPDAA